jgi:hypothetical protein
MDWADIISGIELEWEPDRGFFWKLRQGVFGRTDFDRTLGKLASVPSMAEPNLPSRLVSVIWYIPIFMRWQADRVHERGVDPKEYVTATNLMTAEVERILGVP